MPAVGFLKRVFSEFGRDKAGQMSAAFAYIAVFSIGPLLLVLISIVGFIFGQRAAQGQLYSHLSSVMGPAAAKNIQNVIAHSHGTGKGIIALVIGAAGSLLGAAGLTTQLQNSFDVIFRAVPDPSVGIKKTVYTKIKNVSVLILGSLTVAASLVISALVSGLGQKINSHIGIPAIGLELLNDAVSLLIFIMVIYLVYRVLPDVKIPKKVAMAAAAVISLLFLIGKILLAIIIGRNGTASAYGAAASVIVLLLWFYYTAQIMLMGAEGVKVYGLNHNLDYRPKRYTLKRRTLDVNVKDDLRGRLLDAFARGYKSKNRK